MDKGFLIQTMYRMDDGIPVIMLFGKLENNETFLARITTFYPYFYIPVGDLEKARKLASFKHEVSSLKTMDGKPVVRLEFRNPGSVPDIRNHFFMQGIQCFEADVRFVYRYLIDKRIRGSLNIDGNYRKGSKIDRIYDNPDINSDQCVPDLKILSLDIETDSQGTTIYSISTYDGVEGKTYMLGAPNLDTLENGKIFDTETTLLRAFFRDFFITDPDIITGWNVINFDFAFMEKRCKDLNLKFDFGRVEGRTRFITDETYTMSARLEIPGRQVLDGIQLLRGAFIKLEDYSLDTAAQEILGKSKKISNKDKGKQIDEWFRYDKQRLAEYNFHDALLVYEILRKTGTIDLAVTRSRLTGMALDRVGASVASFDFLYLMGLRQREYVAPCVAGDRGKHSVLGGYVLEATPGIYENIIVLDFKSLYPTIIMTFNIDPLMLVTESQEGKEYIQAPNGAQFKKEQGILPEILQTLFSERELAKEQGDKSKSQALKILMNSFYGVLATPNCRFYSVDLANAITYFGQYFLRKTANLVKELKFQSIYGDTDSIFVKSETREFDQAVIIAEKLRDSINKGVNTHIKEKFGLENYLEVEFERVYWRFFLPYVRHGSEGSKKRYAGISDPGNPESITFVGLETVRRDWTDLAKIVQRELLVRVFARKDVTEFLKNLVKDLKIGKYDDFLVYRKMLRKNVEEYTKTTPPHVKAAKKQSRITSRLISYVMTTDGPEPARERSHPPYYKHYIEKQITPVADSILVFIDKNIESIIQPVQQLDLFQ